MIDIMDIDIVRCVVFGPYAYASHGCELALEGPLAAHAQEIRVATNVHGTANVNAFERARARRPKVDARGA